MWSELFSPRELARPGHAGLLRRYRLGVIAAVRPWQLDEIDRLLDWARDEGLRLSLWPMVSDADGRWLSAATVPAFTQLFSKLVPIVERAAARGAAPAEIALDLEPDLSSVARMFRGGRAGASAALSTIRFGWSRDGLERARRLITFADALSTRLGSLGIAQSAAVVPFTLFDPVATPRRSSRSLPRPAGFQRLLGTPVDALRLEHVSAMAYSTLMLEAGRPLLRRRDVVAFVELLGRAAVERFELRAGLSLGAVGVGALGDEPIYASPTELAEDTLAAERAGIRRLSLFELHGVVARPPADDWLEAFTAPGRFLAESSGAVAALPRRARVAVAALRAFSAVTSPR